MDIFRKMAIRVEWLSFVLPSFRIIILSYYHIANLKASNAALVFALPGQQWPGFLRDRVPIPAAPRPR